MEQLGAKIQQDMEELPFLILYRLLVEQAENVFIMIQT